ncbi:MAG: hypothetical protein O3A01_07745, partial [bacterium]|nr:hypothetical protein [bacterium]
KPAENGFVANHKTYPTLKEAIILLARERNIDIAVIKPATYDNPADLDEDIYTVSGSSTDLAYKKYYTAPDGAAEADRAAGSPTATGIDLQALKTKALKENLEEKEISQLILFVGLGAKDEGLPKALAKYKKLSAPEQKLLIMAIANGVTFDEAVSTIQTAKFESQAKAASRLTATGADEEPIVIASLIASNAKQGFQSGELKALAKLYHTSFNGDFLVSFKTTVMVLKKPNDFVKWVLKAPSPTTEDLEQDVATFKEESRTGSKGLLKFGGRKGGSPTGSDASSSEGGSVASGEGSTPSMASRLIGVFRRKPTGSQEELRSTGAASAASGGSAVNADGDEIYGTVPTANFPDENIVRGDNKKLVASLKPGEYFIGVSASTLKTTMYYCNSQGTAKYDEFTMPLTQEQVNAIASGRSVSNLMIPDGAGELKPNPPSRL